MVNEYKKLAKSFEEAKTKQDDPKSESTNTDWEQSVDMLTLQNGDC